LLVLYDIIRCQKGEIAISARVPFRRYFRRRDLRLFLQIYFVSLLAKGAAFLPAYSIDDYALVQLVRRSTAMIGQGRFGQDLLVRLLNALGLEPSYARTFFVAFGLATWSLLAMLVVRWWGLRREGWLPVAAGCLIALHPFTTEIFTFRTALGTCTVALALATLLLLPRRWSPGLVVAGSALFCLALSIYQVVLHFLVMIVLMGAALSLARYLAAGAALGWSRRWAALLTWRRLARHRQAALSVCIVVGTAFYMACNRIITALLHVPLMQRTELLSAGALGQRIGEVASTLRQRLILPDPLLLPLAQRLLLALLALAVVGLLVRRSVWSRPRAAAVAWGGLALIALGLIWSIGLLLVLREYWPVARVMSHVGIFWAGALAVAWILSGSWRRAGLAGIAALVILSFIGADNHILEDQLRINRRDILKADRIVARIEALPRFREIENLAVDGGSWRFPLGFPTQDHDMNISAFGSKWTRVHLFREVSGYDWRWGGKEPEMNPDPALAEAAAVYCRGVEPWPAPDSVAMQGSLAIVCLPPP
jgi:hypothetical protein